MKAKTNLSLLALCLLYFADLSTSEFVPVYMWGTHSTTEPTPALHKISQNTFKDDIIEKLKTNPTVVVFAEQSLSPEDFGHRDKLGNIAFPNLSKVRKTSKATYLSYVQSPLKAIKHASDDVSEVSVESLLNNVDIPESKVLIIDLNDAREGEQRFDMLKRHDEFIVSTYNEILKKHDNVLALYTSHRASWIGSGEVHSRKSRSLLAETKVSIIDLGPIFFYTYPNLSTPIEFIDVKKNQNHLVTLTYTAENGTDGNIILTGKGDGTAEVIFEFSNSSGYWYLQKTSISYDNLTLFENRTVSNATIYAPFGFSYACGNHTFRNSYISVSFPHLQVEPLYKQTYLTKDGKFNDPYNCVGFTSIPILSGLFVTLILMIIMTFGLTMMMDIKTMDRFDDPKGKTITINTSE